MFSKESTNHLFFSAIKMFFAKKTLANQKRSGPPSLLVSTSGVKVRPEPTRLFKEGWGGTLIGLCLSYTVLVLGST